MECDESGPEARVDGSPPTSTQYESKLGVGARSWSVRLVLARAVSQ